MFVPFSPSGYENSRYGLTPVVLENWYAQPCPDHPGRDFRLVPAPGLLEVVTTGLGDEAGALFQSDAVLGGDLVACTGDSVHRITQQHVRSTVTGSVATGGPAPQFAASQTPELVLVSGGSTYTVGASVASFTWAGPTGDITSVDVIGQRHLYTEEGSGRLWISDTADATTVTNFVTAEADPDEVRCVKVHRNTIYIFGSRKIEAAYLTGDTDTPVAFRPSFLVDRGIVGARAVTSTRSDVVFVGDDFRVYQLNGGRPFPISTEPLVALLEEVAVNSRDDIRLHTYSQANHEWVVLSIPLQGEYFFDVDNRLWHRRKRLGQYYSGIGPLIEAYGRVYTLDNTPSVDTALLRLDMDRFLDRGGAIERIATALVHLPENDYTVDNMVIECQTGVALDGDQLGSEPIIWAQIARDGRSFENAIEKTLGTIGEFRHRPTFAPLGMFHPGMIAVQVGMSAPVGVALTGLLINTRSRK